MRSAKTVIGLLSAVLLYALAAGCADNMPSAEPSSPSYEGRANNMSGQTAKAPEGGEDKETATEPPMAENAPARIQLANFQESQPDRFLIKNASITLEVKEAKAASDKLAQAMRAMRGYLSDMQESVDALGIRSVTMQVRVPAKGFDGAMQQIETLGRVMERHVGAEDVTEEFVDSQSRLRNLKRTEERLLAHMSRTGKLSDTLLVERELSRVRQEIEQLEGRLRYLANRIAYSTISVTLQEAARATSPIPPQTFSSGQVASDASRSLIGFAQSIWSVTIWLAIWSPAWIPLAVATAFVARRNRRSASSVPV